MTKRTMTKTIGQYFEEKFPTIIDELDISSSQDMWDCPLDSVVGEASKTAIDRAMALDDLIAEGHGPFYRTHRKETLDIARVAFNLSNLYYYG